jgi:hypothetical protein
VPPTSRRAARIGTSAARAKCAERRAAGENGADLADEVVPDTPEVRVVRGPAAVERGGEIGDDAFRRLLDRGPEVERDRHLLPQRRAAVEDHAGPAQERLVPGLRQVVREERSHQREGEHEPGVARTDRDRPAADDPLVRAYGRLGEHRHREPEAGAAESEGRGDERGARRGKERERDEAGG